MLVVAVVLLLVFVVFGGRSNNTPEQAARSYVDVINKKDIDGLRKLTCQAQLATVDDAARAIDPASARDVPPEYRSMTVRASLGAVDQEDGSHATAAVMLTFQNVPERARSFINDTTEHVALVREDGGWKVCS